jgi:hypothetical protein
MLSTCDDLFGWWDPLRHWGCELAAELYNYGVSTQFGLSAFSASTRDYCDCSCNDGNLTACGRNCVDIQTHTFNCGGCNRVVSISLHPYSTRLPFHTPPSLILQIVPLLHRSPLHLLSRPTSGAISNSATFRSLRQTVQRRRMHRRCMLLASMHRHPSLERDCMRAKRAMRVCSKL